MLYLDILYMLLQINVFGLRLTISDLFTCLVDFSSLFITLDQNIIPFSETEDAQGI